MISIAHIQISALGLSILFTTFPPLSQPWIWPCSYIQTYIHLFMHTHLHNPALHCNYFFLGFFASLTSSNLEFAHAYTHTNIHKCTFTKHIHTKPCTTTTFSGASLPLSRPPIWPCSCQSLCPSFVTASPYPHHGTTPLLPQQTRDSRKPPCLVFFGASFAPQKLLTSCCVA